jgi:hypothetical protein
MRPLQLLLGPAWDDTAQQFEARLQPADLMEASLVAQVVRAHWRLQRCETLENPGSPDIERVRHHAEGSIRRSLAELRQLQADRHLNSRLNTGVPGVARVREVLQSSALAAKLATPVPAPAAVPPSAPQPSPAAIEARISAVLAKEEKLHEGILKIRTHFEPEPTPRDQFYSSHPPGKATGPRL